MRDDDGAQLVADHAAIETACGGARACLPGSGAARPIYPHHRRHAGIAGGAAGEQAGAATWRTASTSRDRVYNKCFGNLRRFVFPRRSCDIRLIDIGGS